jgi:hypothetical protein
VGGGVVGLEGGADQVDLFLGDEDGVGDVEEGWLGMGLLGWCCPRRRLG